MRLFDPFRFDAEAIVNDPDNDDLRFAPWVGNAIVSTIVAESGL